MGGYFCPIWLWILFSAHMFITSTSANTVLCDYNCRLATTDYVDSAYMYHLCSPSTDHRLYVLYHISVRVKRRDNTSTFSPKSVTTVVLNDTDLLQK